MKARTRIIRFLLLLLGGFLAFAAVIIVVGLSDNIGKADAALVLGNTVDSQGTPSPRLKARLDRAVELYREGWFPLVIVSGGTGKEGFPEGTAMRNYLVSQGIPPQAIIVDNKGVYTHASAVSTRKILRERQLGSIFVITQHFHIMRSRLALSNLGIGPVYFAHARYFEPRDIYSSLREVPAMVKYMCAGNTPGQEGD